MIASALAACGGGGGGDSNVAPGAAGPPQGRSVTLSWTAPTHNTDGTPLTNLAGFRVHYGLSTGELDQTVEIASPTARSCEISDLKPATWYFTVSAYSSDAESDLSNVAARTVP